MIFPKVTTSRRVFIDWIIQVTETKNIPEERTEEWVQHVKKAMSDAHYFYGMIFVEEMSPHLLFHEFFHHVSQLIRNVVHTNICIIDYIIDTIEVKTQRWDSD